MSSAWANEETLLSVDEWSMYGSGVAGRDRADWARG